jgi:hypothetical protein
MKRRRTSRILARALGMAAATAHADPAPEDVKGEEIHVEGKAPADKPTLRSRST